MFRMMKNPWLVAASQAAGSMLAPRWVRHTWRPSTYQVADWSAADQSSVYRWKPLVHDVGLQPLGPPLPTPLFSLHGPPGAVPQCCVCQVRLAPLTLSMTSNSPTPGQFHQLPRYGPPSIQNAGQYPADWPLGASGSFSRASTRNLPPGGGWKSCRLVSIRAAVQPPVPCPRAVMLMAPLATDTALGVEVSTSPVPKLAGPPGYEVPWSIRQLPLRALPLKSSRKFWVHPAGTGGAAAWASNATAMLVPAARSAVAVSATRRIRARPRVVVPGCQCRPCAPEAVGHSL